VDPLDRVRALIAEIWLGEGSGDSGEGELMPLRSGQMVACMYQNTALRRTLHVMHFGSTLFPPQQKVDCADKDLSFAHLYLVSESYFSFLFLPDARCAASAIRPDKQLKINSLRNALRRDAWNPLEETQPVRIAITLSA